MMKKIIASFTVIVYFAFSCGVMISYHYCMNQYKSSSLYQAGSDKCSTCGMRSKKHGCCHDEVRIVKLQNDYQNSYQHFSFRNLEPVEIVSMFTAVQTPVESVPAEVTDHAPPIPLGGEIYLQNRVFRI